MLLRKLLALGALAVSVTARDGRPVYARQNESSPEPSGAYSVGPASSPSSETEPQSSADSPTPTSEPVPEAASSVAAQPEPTYTDADKKSTDHGTDTDDCAHWGSKCPWGKTVTVTVTEKKPETVTEKKTETVTVTQKTTDTVTQATTVTEEKPVVST